MRKWIVPSRGQCVSALFAAVSVGLSASAVRATPLFSDDFNTSGSSANYNTFITGTTATGTTGSAATSGSPTGDVTFAYNYGAAPGSGGLSIPAAPHTTDGSTLGVRIRTDNLANTVGTGGAVVGATELVTKGLSLPSTYQIQVDVWSNYIGGTSLAASGSNGTTGVVVAAGTSGTSLDYIANNDGYLADVIHDGGGGANADYRIYVDNASPRPLPTNSSYYAAGTGANSATHTDSYYTSAFPSVSAPAAQSTFSSTQSGSTPAGVPSFAWHTWTITQNGTNMVWAIDGKTITTVPDSALTFGGSQVQLGADDTGSTGNTAANNQLFNADIFDNLTITALPEPGSLSLLGIAGLAVLRRRRQA